MNFISKISDHVINNLHYLIIFLITFIYFTFFADYIFFYQEKSSLFIFSFDYLTDSLHQPGSPVIYLGKFLSTFYYIPIAGSVIISVIICLIVFLTSKILACFTDKHGKLLPIFAGGILFYLQTDYHYLLFNSIGILLQVTFFFLIIKYLKGWLPVLLSPIFYLISGGFFWYLFLMYSIYLTFQNVRKGWIKILVILCLNLLVIFILEEFILFQTFKSLIIYPLSKENMVYPFIFFITMTLFIIVIISSTRIKVRILPAIKIKQGFINIFPALLSLIILITIISIRFDNKAKKYFQAEKLFLQNKFKELIEFNTSNPSANILTSYLNNIALCEKGILNDQLFHFPQKSDGQTLFLKWEMNEEILKRGCYFYYSVGMINEAHRWAFENMVMKGFTPGDLLMLIKTELINGNYQMASKYIMVLKHTIFYHQKAMQFEKLLYNDKAVDSDPELGIKRKNRISKDFFVITDDPLINIDKLLAADSMNLNAFQYKLAYHLIRKDYKDIIEQVPKLPKYGYKILPVHIEEALLVYKNLNLGPLPNLDNIKFREQTQLRFRQFMNTLSSYKNNLKTAEPVLKQNFGTSFWYWALFN